MDQSGVLKPTVQKMDEIIRKLDELRFGIEQVGSVPLEFPESGEADNQRPATEDLIRAAVGLEVQVKALRKRIGGKSKGLPSADEQRELVEKIQMAQGGDQSAAAVHPRLAGLSMKKLKWLRDEFIPRLWPDVPLWAAKPRPLSISAVGHATSGPSRSDEAQRLDAIVFHIKAQIEEKTKAAVRSAWARHVEPIHEEFKRLCYPFETYLNGHASSKQENAIIEKKFLDEDDRSVLLDCQRWLERIRYKLEVEAEERKFRQDGDQDEQADEAPSKKAMQERLCEVAQTAEERCPKDKDRRPIRLNGTPLSDVLAKCMSVRQLAGLIELITSGRLKSDRYGRADGRETNGLPKWASDVLRGHVSMSPDGRVLVRDEARIAVLDDPTLCAEAYFQARRTALRLWENEPTLTAIPAENNSPSHGLLDLKKWCVENMPNTKASDELDEHKQPHGTSPESPPAKRLKDCFTFNPGQALFDGKDLKLPSDAPIAVLKKLVRNFGQVVPYTDFDKHYSSATPGTLPKSVSKIREAFRRHKVPCEIRSKTGGGYVICETAPPTERKKRVRKRS